MGRVCSALPGAMVDGMGVPCARHYVPAVGNGAPSIPAARRAALLLASIDNLAKRITDETTPTWRGTY